MAPLMRAIKAIGTVGAIGAIGAMGARAVTAPTHSRAFAGGFDERERGEELVHFRREDERLLRQLLNKVKKQADSVEGQKAADELKDLEVKRIKDIVGQDVSPKVIEDLLGWKHDV